MPRVSVVMAVYNGERYLRDAVESILGQSYTDLELLIVNDGSTDRTQEIIRSLTDPRVRSFTNGRNLGLPRSLNRAIDLARGELIARQDADDLSEPRRLEKQVAFLDQHPQIALLGSWYREIDAAGRRIAARRKPCDHLDIRWAMLFYCPFVHTSVIFRKQRVLRKVGGYNEALATSQDFELWTRIARCLGVANLGEYLVRFRVHEDSLTSTQGARAGVGHRMRVEAVSNLLGRGEEDFARQERRLEAMTRLLLGTPGACSVEDLEDAVDEIFRLHGAFCREAGVAAAEATRHRARLRAEVSENLVVLAASCGLRQPGAARRLLRRAYRLHRPVFFRGRALARSGKRVVQSLLVPRQAVPDAR